jgi:hypothetical protein
VPSCRWGKAQCRERRISAATFDETLRRLSFERSSPKEAADVSHVLRKFGNAAVYDAKGGLADALTERFADCGLPPPRHPRGASLTRNNQVSLSTKSVRQSPPTDHELYHDALTAPRQ